MRRESFFANVPKTDEDYVITSFDGKTAEDSAGNQVWNEDSDRLGWVEEMLRIIDYRWS